MLLISAHCSMLEAERLTERLKLAREDLVCLNSAQEQVRDDEA